MPAAESNPTTYSSNLSGFQTPPRSVARTLVQKNNWGFVVPTRAKSSFMLPVAHQRYMVNTQLLFEPSNLRIDVDGFVVLP